MRWIKNKSKGKFSVFYFFGIPGEYRKLQNKELYFVTDVLIEKFDCT